MVSVGDIAAAFAVGISRAALKPIRPSEPGPATERWGVGVGGVAASLPGLPGPLRGIARRLNRFGSLDAITEGVNRIPLWRFPGRGLVLSGLSQAALTAVAVVADLKLDEGVFCV